MEDISLSLRIQQPSQLESSLPPKAQSSAMLHTVRKPPAKSWRRPEPPPPKVYHVEPRGFRKLVQKLTGARHRVVQSGSAPNPRPLRDTLTPPPPLDLAPRCHPPPPAYQQYNYYSQEQDTNPATPTKSLAADKGFMGMLSPSLWSPRWCSLLSPGTMASLELITSPIL